MDITKQVILTGENPCFAMDPACGAEGLIEIKSDGKQTLVKASMKNIKHFKDNQYTYKLLFAGMKGDKWHYHMLGDMPVSPEGSGHKNFTLTCALHEFSAAIICAMSNINRRESLHPVLKGNFSFEAPCKRDAEPKDYSSFYNKYVLERCIAIAKVQDRFIDVIPFKHDLTSAQWKKISQCSLFPIVAPGAMTPMETYQHFLFGFCDSHYFLGIPGRFFPQEQPDGGKSGFVLWQPLLGMEEESEDKSIPIEKRRENIYGYWIASINRYNGHIEEFPLIEK